MYHIYHVVTYIPLIGSAGAPLEEAVKSIIKNKQNNFVDLPTRCLIVWRNIDNTPTDVSAWKPSRVTC